MEAEVGFTTKATKVFHKVPEKYSCIFDSRLFFGHELHEDTKNTIEYKLVAPGKGNNVF